MLQITEDQEMYLKILNEFMDQEVKPRLKELNSVDEFPMYIRDRMAELGFSRLMVPEEYGGMGEKLTTLLLLIMEAAKVNNSVASMVNCSNTGLKLVTIGNEKQIETFLPGIMEKGLFMGMAYTEAQAGSDARAIETRAVLDGDEWVINGTKTFISYRSCVGFWQLSAKTVDENGKEGISAFFVDANAPGISYGTHITKFGLLGSDAGDVYLKNCRIPKWCLIGEVNKGLRVALSTLDASRLIIATRAIGFAQGALEQALEYSKQRVQFGRPIGDNQIIQHYFADMATGIDVAKSYVLSLAEKVDAGMPIGKGGSMAKLFCTEMAQKVSEKAISICGGIGLVRDFGIDRFYKDARVLTIVEGTNEIQRNIIYRAVAKGD